MDGNKTELFALLARAAMNVGQKTVLTTLGSDVLSNQQMNLDDIRPCT